MFVYLVNLFVVLESHSDRSHHKDVDGESGVVGDSERLVTRDQRCGWVGGEEGGYAHI